MAHGPFRTRWLIVVAVTVLVVVACAGPSGDAGPPVPPDAVTAAPGPGYVDVSWQHDGRAATAFVLYRRTVEGGAVASTLAGIEPLAEVAADTRTFRDDTVVVGVGYEYAVEARGEGGTSSMSHQAGGTVSAACSTPDSVVTVLDPALAAGIVAELDLATEAITCGHLAALTELVVQGAGVASLAGLQYASNLTTLRLNDNAVARLWPLAGLTSLEHLQVSGNDVADLDPIAGLAAMRVLMLSDNPIESISVVAGFADLQYLGAARTPISDIGVLADKPQLIYLWLNDATGISDFTPLAGLIAMRFLLIGGTQFGDADMPMLATMPELTRLQLWATDVSDLSALAGLDLRDELDVGATAVSDLTPIHAMTSLQQLRLYGLGLSAPDLGFLTAFDELTRLDLHGNDLTSLAAVVAIEALADGAIVDVRFNHLNLDDAEVQADIATLEGRGVDLTYLPQHGD